VQSERELLQVISAPHPPGRLAGRLNGGQEQSDQNPDDRNDDE
jgi:hypothetical protein